MYQKNEEKERRESFGFFMYGEERIDGLYKRELKYINTEEETKVLILFFLIFPILFKKKEVKSCFFDAQWEKSLLEENANLCTRIPVLQSINLETEICIELNEVKG